jgi:predicted acylesterase/phospholipase RssA
MKAAMSGARGPAFRATQKTAKPNMHLESVVWGGECPLLVAWRCHTIPAILLILSLLVVGCSGIDRSPPEPANLTDQSTVLGIPNARFYADTQAVAMAQEALRAVERERAAVRPGAAGLEGRLPPADLLAISGGSDDGAFGAGLLVGWTDAGTRPEFKLVSGVSTGALIAPFAFLGSAYDSQLRAIYTGVQPADIYEKRLILTAVFHESFADTAPLFALISRHFDEEMMAAIAREYGKGRLLLIGTTNLDSQRPVIWNIGAIAASGSPGAIELVRKILLASASVPGLFPPVLVDVEAGGQRFQEMHVDGGAVAQMFLYPPSLGLQANVKAIGRERHAFLIRNSRLDPDWASVERSLFSITGRAISTMIHYSGYNDVLRIYATTQRDGVDYNLAFIGPDFNVEHKVPFDQAYMRALFDYGYQRGRAGYAWRKAPPILGTTANSNR